MRYFLWIIEGQLFINYKFFQKSFYDTLQRISEATSEVLRNIKKNTMQEDKEGNLLPLYTFP